MELTPRRTFDRGFMPLRRQIDRLFEDFFGGSGSGDHGAADLWGRGRWAPALDVAETEGELVISVEVPGMNAEDIEITVTGEYLTLSGVKKSESEGEEGEGGYHRRERVFGRFSRTINLPATVDHSAATAVAKDGILTLRLPKKEEAKPKRIEVKVE